MESEPTEAFATRLPASESEQLKRTIEETDQTKSTLVRRAIRYYVKENPDRIQALYPEDSIERFMAELGK